MKDKIINSFSNSLKELVDDVIIQDKKIFVTLKAQNSNQAKELEGLKIECEKKNSKERVERVLVLLANTTFFSFIE